MVHRAAGGTRELMMLTKHAGWQIMIVEGERPWLPTRSASAEARELATVVPVKIAERWRIVRLEMTTALARRVREDRN
jgi:hypothetical protein